jgi:hypothetical protein
MWYWRWMEKTLWTDYVRNGEVLYKVKEERNILRTIKIRKDYWIGHILHRNSFLKLYLRKDRKSDRSDRKKRKNIT